MPHTQAEDKMSGLQADSVAGRQRCRQTAQQADSVAGRQAGRQAGIQRTWKRSMFLSPSSFDISAIT